MSTDNKVMDYSKTVKNAEILLSFIKASPSVFHTTETLSRYYTSCGFEYLPENEVWSLVPGGKYYTKRNNSSIIAFNVGKDAAEDLHFQICASHGDSPTFKLKDVPEVEGPADYLRLNVEGYGGMIENTWFDRPLSIAGRVLVRENVGIKSRLIYIDEDMLIIPSMAIHLNKDANNGYKFNKQVDLLPLMSASSCKSGTLADIIAAALGIKPEDILGKDLDLVNRQDPVIWGVGHQFISSPRLDDLECAFISAIALANTSNNSTVNVCCCFDNEEVGSNTKQGAMSTFLADTLKRINKGLGRDDEGFIRAAAASYMLSCDNAHAVHPNHPEKTDSDNAVYLNKGIVIKENASQKYTTDAFSRAIIKEICNRSNIPVQSYANRSDIAGGSTLGNLSNIEVSMHAADIGLPQLAMHSSFETAGCYDIGYMADALSAFYKSNIVISGADSAVIK